MRKRGFTLVEMLVVLVIVGILVALVLPNALNAIREGNRKDCGATLRNIDTAIQQCYTETRNWASCNTIAELVPNYLERAPVCPLGAVSYAPIGGAGGGFVSPKAAHFANWPVLAPHTGAGN